jgi:hypothetical protein
MTHEETLVRTAYAKFTYAAEQDVIGNLALEATGAKGVASEADRALPTEQRLANAIVTFKLSDFKTGTMNEIANRKATDLISLPIGEILLADTPEYGYVEGGVGLTWVGLQPHWRPAGSGPDQWSWSPETLNETIGTLAHSTWGDEATWQRYASYSVTVTFRGKSRGPYNALFLFGRDSKGNEMVMPQDATTDSIGLADVMTIHLFPEAFVRSRLRATPVVPDWLNSAQKSSPSCSTGQRDVCCDLEQLKCGPGIVDVANWMTRPLPTPGKKGD